jgi:hypothetical protein
VVSSISALALVLAERADMLMCLVEQVALWTVVAFVCLVEMGLSTEVK